MLAKPSRGLPDSVPGTFPPGRREDEAQDAGSHPGAPEPELAGEASPQPSGLPVPSWCGMLEEGSAHPRTWRGLVRAHELVHAGRPSGTPSQEPCHMECRRTKPRMGVPKPGPARDLARDPARAPELEPEGEASMGPVDSQASSA
ncbi:hypothetical protein NDU88_001735 [Pleurodeles waltl]|uniref:Uncharacterized protein n=1 Tax=Pleurodeles waltl TaxID=8319 RepID=A0AAV7UWV1_PLEWA|nr:hypothetical protein NDU88_001735 [Pleurodeles waltl]